MIFIPFATAATEDLPEIYYKILLILRLNDESFLRYKAEIKPYIESALEFFLYEQLYFDENLVLSIVRSYYRLMLIDSSLRSDNDLLHWIYFAILSLKLGKISLLEKSISFCDSAKLEEFNNLLISEKDIFFKEELDQIKSLYKKSKDLEEQEVSKDESFFKTLRNPSFNQKILSAFAVSKDYEDELVDDENLLPDSNPNRFPELDDYSRKYLPSYLDHPEIFHKKMRKSKERKELLGKLLVTDEQIEGWALVFEKNPHKNAIINMFLENQNEEEAISARLKTI
jgi:hypothetical protein